MERLYSIHLFSLVLFLFLGGCFMYDLVLISESERSELVDINAWEEFRYLIRFRFLMNVYVICTLFLFVFFVLFGWKINASLKKVGIMLFLEVIGFLIWSILMLNN